MKKFILFARVGLLFTLVLLKPAIGAHYQSSLTEFPNYVVIGAFAIEKNAVKFTQQANASNHHAQFDINPNRNLYYVYVLTTNDHDQAIAEALRLRRESRYEDAWVYHGTIGKQSAGIIGRDINPVDQKPLADVSPAEQNVDTPTADNPVIATSADTMVTSEPATPQLTQLQLSEDEIAERNFIFNLFSATDNEPIEGEVDVIDTEKSRKMASYKGNTPVKISAPSGKSGDVSFICEVFGYRKAQSEFSFKGSDNKSLTVDDQGNIVIPFGLVRLQKGDIAVMYNVFFFKDAAVMRPESRFEVNSLQEMLKENPSYKIKIHGHTNGNAAGKVISMGESNNFFSLSGTKEGYGSAKKLSEERAAAIKSYLVSNGIAEDRMQIKAWGGKRPIHDKHATRAQENVRVEIEILAN